MELLTIPARSLLSFEPLQLKEVLCGEFYLQFDDGEKLKATPRATIFSRYCWDLHKQVPTLPLLSTHHVNHLYPKTNDPVILVKGDAQTKILGNIINTWHDTHPDHHPDERLTMWRLFMESVNRLYNELGVESEPYLNGNSLLDVVNLINDPEIKAIRASEDISPLGIVNQQTQIGDYIKKVSNERLDKNPLVRSLRAGFAKQASLIQRIGPYGYPRDVDESVFRYVNLRGYAQGFRSAYSVLTESRTSARALFLAGHTLSTSEYFSRKLVLNNSTLARIHKADCGSPHLRSVIIENEKELECYIGKFMVDKDGKLVAITKNHKDLIGHIVNIRHPAGCLHKDPQGFCETCFGQLGRNVLPHSNIGAQSTTILTSDMSQKVMGAKHQVGSAKADPIRLTFDMVDYFEVVGANKNQYAFNKRLKGKKFFVILPREEMVNFMDILDCENIHDIEPSNITKFSKLSMNVRDDRELGKNTRLKFNMAYQHRDAYLTREAIDYIRKNMWILDRMGNYIIHLENWDFDQPFMEIPIRVMSALDYRADVEKFLKYPPKNLKTINMYTNALAKMIWQQMSVNIANIEVIAMACTAVSEKDFSIAKPWTTHWIAGSDDPMFRRSFSLAMAYEKHARSLTSGFSFVTQNVMDSYTDWTFVPEQVQNYIQID